MNVEDVERTLGLESNPEIFTTSRVGDTLFRTFINGMYKPEGCSPSTTDNLKSYRDDFSNLDDHWICWRMKPVFESGAEKMRLCIAPKQ